MASGYSLNDHAQTILNAVHDLDPKSAVPAIGAAVRLLNAGRADEAAILLQRAENDVAEKDRAALQAILGWSLQLSGRQAESERVLAALEMAPETPDGPAGLARALLNQGADKG